MKKNVIWSVILVTMLFTTSAFATKIFLNGVDITGIKNKSFSKVKVVKIDGKGNVHLNAPQYEVKVLETGGDAKAEKKAGNETAGVLTEKYFIATQGAVKTVQYKFIVKINGVERMVIGAKESNVIEEITGWLKKGKNTITITAEKKIGPEGRLSTAKSDELTLMIGKGHEDKKIVKIDSLKATFKCNASQLNTFTKTYTIQAK